MAGYVKFAKRRSLNWIWADFVKLYKLLKNHWFCILCGFIRILETRCVHCVLNIDSFLLEWVDVFCDSSSNALQSSLYDDDHSQPYYNTDSHW